VIVMMMGLRDTCRRFGCTCGVRGGTIATCAPKHGWSVVRLTSCGHAFGNDEATRSLGAFLVLHGHMMGVDHEDPRTVRPTRVGATRMI
jgi:hypothetical protein